jgi:hypothetical protein
MTGRTPFTIPVAVKGAAAASLQSVPGQAELPFVKVLAVRPDKSGAKVGETVTVALDLLIPRRVLHLPATAPSVGKPTKFQAAGAKLTGSIGEPPPKSHKTEGQDPYAIH